MEFNPLTYVFEIINFFVLLWILKKILYNPVISVLKKRKELIDKKFEEYDRVSKEIENLRKEKEKLISNIEKLKKEKLAEVMKEIQEEKEKLHKRMKEELESERKKFLEALQKEREELLKEVKDEALKFSLTFTSKLLSYFADENLHKKLFNHAIKSLESFKNDEYLRNELFQKNEVLVETAIPLSREEIENLKNKIAEIFGVQVKVREEVRRNLISGVRIYLGSKVIDTSLEGQLSAFESIVREKVERKG